MILGLTWIHLESVWNPSGPSEVPYSTNHQLVRNYFCCFLQQTDLMLESISFYICSMKNPSCLPMKPQGKGNPYLTLFWYKLTNFENLLLSTFRRYKSWQTNCFPISTISSHTASSDYLHFWLNSFRFGDNIQESTLRIVCKDFYSEIILVHSVWLVGPPCLNWHWHTTTFSENYLTSTRNSSSFFFYFYYKNSQNRVFFQNQNSFYLIGCNDRVLN